MKPFDWQTLRWEYRVLVILADDSETKAVQEQLEAVRARRAAFDERDMLLLQLYANGEGLAGDRVIPAEAVRDARSRFAPIENELPEVVLIGKDGGVKWRGPAPADLDAIFARIDRMPMRRAEMR